MAPKLPGFYFDGEKGKYFKIIPDCASTTGSKHSKTAVKETEDQLHELKKRDFHGRQQRKHRIQRSQILRLHPLGGMLSLERECGAHEGHPRSAASEIWTMQLRSHNLIQWPGSSRPDNPSSIRHFIQDPATGAIAYAMDYSKHSYDPNSPHVCVPIQDLYKIPITGGRYRMDHTTPLAFCPTSEISSMSISPSRFVLATALGMRKPPTMHLIPLVNASTFWALEEGLRQQHRGIPYDPSQFLPSLDGDVPSLTTSSKGVHTIWATVASPTVDPTMFAVGDSRGTLVLSLTSNGADLSGQRECCVNEQPAETLAVDFWKPNHVLSGMRSGKVRLWDIRSKGTNIRFQHPSCVSNIRSIDDNKVLVAGLAAKMAIYDTRFTKGYPQSHQGGDIEPSLPLQVFPTYRSGSSFYPRLGFDVHREMGLIASATEDKRLQIFNWKGSKQEIAVGTNGNAHCNVPHTDATEFPHIDSHRHIPRSFRSGVDTERGKPDSTLDGPIRCVKFVEDERRGDGLKLLVANGTRIDEWAW